MSASMDDKQPLLSKTVSQQYFAHRKNKSQKSKKIIKSKCSYLFNSQENETLLDWNLWKSCFAELIGTAIMVSFGCGMYHCCLSKSHFIVQDRLLLKTVI